MKTTIQRSGVSAVEVMCAAVILALGLVPLISMQVRTSKQAGFSRGHALAMLHARAVLDQLAARGAEALAQEAAAGSVAAPAIDAPQGVQLKGAPQVDVTVESPGVVSIAVDVTWSAGSDSKDHRVRAFRLVARRDLSWTMATELPATGRALAD